MEQETPRGIEKCGSDQREGGKWGEDGEWGQRSFSSYREAVKFNTIMIDSVQFTVRT